MERVPNRKQNSILSHGCRGWKLRVAAEADDGGYEGDGVAPRGTKRLNRMLHHRARHNRDPKITQGLSGRMRPVRKGWDGTGVRVELRTGGGDTVRRRAASEFGRERKKRLKEGSREEAAFAGDVGPARNGRVCLRHRTDLFKDESPLGSDHPGVVNAESSQPASDRGSRVAGCFARDCGRLAQRKCRRSARPVEKRTESIFGKCVLFFQVLAPSQTRRRLCCATLGPLSVPAAICFRSAENSGFSCLPACLQPTPSLAVLRGELYYAA